MSQDDVERVARAICIDHTIDLRRAQDFARTAITAYLSALPQRELLAEALDALEPFAAKRPLEIDDFRRARVAADKIRAALTQEKQT
jgi:hypothetical protein